MAEEREEGGSRGRYERAGKKEQKKDNTVQKVPTHPSHSEIFWGLCRVLAAARQNIENTHF